MAGGVPLRRRRGRAARHGGAERLLPAGGQARSLQSAARPGGSYQDGQGWLEFVRVRGVRGARGRASARQLLRRQEAMRSDNDRTRYPFQCRSGHNRWPRYRHQRSQHSQAKPRSNSSRAKTSICDEIAPEPWDRVPRVIGCRPHILRSADAEGVGLEHRHSDLLFPWRCGRCGAEPWERPSNSFFPHEPELRQLLGRLPLDRNYRFHCRGRLPHSRSRAARPDSCT